VLEGAGVGDPAVNVGADVGTGVGLPGKYVGVLEGSGVGDPPTYVGADVGIGVGLPGR